MLRWKHLYNAKRFDECYLLDWHTIKCTRGRSYRTPYDFRDDPLKLQHAIKVYSAILELAQDPKNRHDRALLADYTQFGSMDSVGRIQAKYASFSAQFKATERRRRVRLLKEEHVRQPGMSDWEVQCASLPHSVLITGCAKPRRRP